MPGLGASPRSFRKVRCGEVFGVVTERKSLRDPALTVFWEAVRNRLERSGYRILHVAGVLVRRGGRLILRLDETWPWAAALHRAFIKLRTTFS